MKSIFKLLVVAWCMLQLNACKDDSPSAAETKTAMLTKTTWGHARVTHADGDLSAQYANLAIVFTANASNGFDGTFMIANGGYAFSESSGRWKFSDDLTQIMLDSDKVMDFQLNKESLELDFTVPPAGGKVAGLSGHFTVELQPL